MAHIHLTGPEDRRLWERTQLHWGELDHTISAAWLVICVGLLFFWAAVLAFVA